MLRPLLLPLLLLIASPAPAQETVRPQLTLFSLGSGDVAGGYYSAARSICQTINRIDPAHLRCSPEPTSGSLYNLTMLRQKELEFAFAQSDWQRDAVDGAGPFTAIGPYEALRSVLSLYPETITILVNKGAGIEVASDLPGKRLDIGVASSARHASFMRLLDVLPFEADDFPLLTEYAPDTALDELCAGRIDAAVFVMGHPNQFVARALDTCPVRLLPFSDPQIDSALSGLSDYSPTRIPISAYPQLTVDVDSYSVIATIVTRADVPASMVEQLTGSIIDNLETLAATNPIFSRISVEDMRSRGLSAPPHPGAEAAFAARAAAD